MAFRGLVAMCNLLLGEFNVLKIAICMWIGNIRLLAMKRYLDVMMW